MSPGLLSLCLSLCLAWGPTPPEPRSASDAAAVLRAWDQRRAQAWADGDRAALGDLYTERSRAGRADRAMLRAWTRRGLRVEQMRMQLLAVVVRRASPARLELRVTDRLAGGVAVGAGRRLVLPRDGVSTHTLVLVRDAWEWRVDAVVDQARPVRTTSWTVRSRNS